MGALELDGVLQLTSQAMMLCLMISLPAVVVSAVVGLLVAFFQAITSLQDASISQGIKLLCVTGVTLLAAPWGATALLRFSESVMTAVFQ